MWTVTYRTADSADVGAWTGHRSEGMTNYGTGSAQFVTEDAARRFARQHLLTDPRVFSVSVERTRD